MHGRYWARCIRDAKPGPQARFKESMEFFFNAISEEASNRDVGLTPDIESYISVSLALVYFLSAGTFILTSVGVYRYDGIRAAASLSSI